MKRPTSRSPGGLQLFTAPPGRARFSPEVELAQRWVTNWLNGDHFDPSKRAREVYTEDSRDRILALLGLIRRGMQATQTPRNTPGRWPNAQSLELKHDPFVEVAGPVMVDLLPAVTEAMQPYAVFPSLSFHHGPKRWHVVRELAPSNIYPAGETAAAHGLIELVRCDCIDRLRTCECGRWYYAKRADGIACSDSCRKRIHDRTDKAKETRKTRLKANADYNSGKVFVKGTPDKSKPSRRIP